MHSLIGPTGMKSIRWGNFATLVGLQKKAPLLHQEANRQPSQDSSSESTRGGGGESIKEVITNFVLWRSRPK